VRATASDTLLVLVGGILLLTLQLGFALREMGAVHRHNQIHAFGKIICLFAVSVIAYLTIGFRLAYGGSPLSLLTGSAQPAAASQLFVLLSLSSALAVIVSGAIAERARFWPQIAVAAVLAGILYPMLEQVVRVGRWYAQHLMLSSFGAEFHDFAGSVVVHGFAGWLALPAMMVLGARQGRFDRHGEPQPLPPVNLPLLLLGSWILVLTWFGVSVLGAQRLPASTGLVAANGLLAIMGGIAGVLAVNRGNTGLVHGGALAGLIAIGAGADLVHPAAAAVIGLVGGALLIPALKLGENYWKVDDVVGIWPLHGLAGAWGAFATGIFGQVALGGRGGTSLVSQTVGTVGIVGVGIVSGFVMFGFLQRIGALRVSRDLEVQGADGGEKQG
jgi:Amt family ammonium transporter